MSHKGTAPCSAEVLKQELTGFRGVHLELYHSQEECLDLIDYYLKNESHRKRIAQNRYQFLHVHRTLDVVLDEMISRIENDHLNEDPPP